MIPRCCLVIFALILATPVRADLHPIEAPRPSPETTSAIWDASWITPPNQPARAYGVHHFRKRVELTTAPEKFVVNVSADNRYRLFVNGHPIHTGPARGDLLHWRFDTLDLAPWLQPGSNLIAVQVWNFAEHGPVAQETDQTAFIMQGDTAHESAINTNTSWKVMTNPAYTPITDIRAKLRTYIVVGPGDDVDGAKYPWGWEQSDFDDSSWGSATSLRQGYPRGLGTDGRWLLVPRQIPLMESRKQRLQAVRQTTGVTVSDAFVTGRAPVNIPANTQAMILLDQAEHTTAFPQIRVSGGKGAEITLTYAESLYEGSGTPFSNIKGHRDEVAGKSIRGFEDKFRPDGGMKRVFRPLRWRTYRYLQITVNTGDAPLVLEDIWGDYTAYPFMERARFGSSDPTLAGIWEIAWRTMRTGSHEIFTDSPYYEQLSYVGDSRIEALVSLLVSGDDRLMRKTIEAFDGKRNSNGLTSSRWPDSRHQIIPPYSLVWISMVHDFWRWRDDPAFVRQQLPGVRNVLRYFHEHSEPDTGAYRVDEWWNFVDWIPAWGKDNVTGLGGVPPLNKKRQSAIIDLQHVYVLQQAADLFASTDHPAEARLYRDRATRIRQHILDTCWDSDREMLADTDETESYSQHANALLILTTEGDAKAYADLARRILADPTVTPTTFYFSFYSHEAWNRAGLGENYSQWLDPWREMLEQGLTTVPEKPELDTRSDSHAWGTHPMLGMLNTLCGINSGSAGFKTVIVAPQLGSLSTIEGSLPHPQGDVQVRFQRVGKTGISGEILLPPGISGEFHWQGQTLPLEPGSTKITR